MGGLSVVLASSYQAAVELMPAIAIGCALHALGTVLAQPLLANKRTRLLLLGRVCGAVTAALCIPLMGNEISACPERPGQSHLFRR